MKNLIHFVLFVLVFTAAVPIFLFGAIDINDTKFLSQPAICENHIAFVYAGDLWVADSDGKNVRRLTSDDGIESNPVFSPNRKLIAFSAEYDGNTDVFIVPIEGGVPKRLTWHPGFDIVRGFTPDGSAVLFISGRNVFTNRYTQLFTVPIDGGFPESLKIPNAYKATYSPDGKKLAYNPLGERFRQWKNYRGGTVSRIWLYMFSDHSVEKLPQPEGRCNDIDAMWIGNHIYFLSDRNGEFNLFHYDINSKEIKQLTNFSDFPIIDASAGDNKIIFEQAGHLHIFDLATNQSKKLTIGVATDLLELRPRYVKGARYIRSAGISPSGARAVIDFRGEIITVPEEKGDPRNLTNTPGVHERFPTWSPDGKTIAYFSDESGEYQLHLQPQDGKGAVKKIKLNGSGFYSNLNWSPDSKKLTFTDNARNLYWVDVEKASIKKIASEYIYQPGTFGNIRGVWSPDSKWIAYTVNSAAYIEKVYLYSIEQDKSYPVTDGLSDVSEPVFDQSGKYIYFFASTDAGPIKHWFAMSNRDMRMTRAIYLATLQKDVPSPLAKESDEEKGIEKKEDEEQDEKSKKEESKKEKDKAEKPFSIDFEGLDSRIITLPVDEGNYFNLQVGDEGKIYYLEASATERSPYAKGTKLHRYDLEKRKDEDIISEVNSYQISHDKKKILYQEGQSWKIVPISGKSENGKGNLDINAIQVLIDPQAEWKQIFDEAWRINRDYFYATNMHGADWNAMRKKYEAFLPHLSCRNDLNRLIQWMCSELAVGHHRVGGGDFYSDPERVPGGLLGADYAIENGQYRFKKIYGGLNWNPELRSPLTEPGVVVKEGEYLLAVNGKELTSAMNLYNLFENTSGKIVEITVGPNPNSTGTRTVTVVPISDEGALRNRDWVEGNLKKVDQATGGRVAYVYVPNTTTLGHTYFKRYFFPQVHKEAIIVDERFNGGGLVADYYIDLLRRPYLCNWNMRYGADTKTPSASIQGPKVMLIDETAGSGGDLLPWMFRKLELGKLIGKRTWGGLVGTLGFPVLMDGGYVSAPNLAIWTEDGWVVENEGVPPDIEVEQLPAQVIAGKDPQLEKAIEVIMEELKKNPPEKLKRPSYPVRVRK
ncbi:PD40 domain-containing protein [candidate division KSB1 bacterium]|nr:PD40 domain-containing protein [candidate division KSB1 bacterium]